MQVVSPVQTTGCVSGLLSGPAAYMYIDQTLMTLNDFIPQISV